MLYWRTTVYGDPASIGGLIKDSAPYHWRLDPDGNPTFVLDSYVPFNADTGQPGSNFDENGRLVGPLSWSLAAPPLNQYFGDFRDQLWAGVFGLFNYNPQVAARLVQIAQQMGNPGFDWSDSISAAQDYMIASQEMPFTTGRNSTEDAVGTILQHAPPGFTKYIDYAAQQSQDAGILEQQSAMGGGGGLGLLALVALAGGAMIFGPELLAFASPEATAGAIAAGSAAVPAVAAGEAVTIDAATASAIASGWEGAVVTSAVQNAAIAEVTGQVAAGTLASTIGADAAAAALADAQATLAAAGAIAAATPTTPDLPNTPPQPPSSSTPPAPPNSPPGLPNLPPGASSIGSAVLKMLTGAGGSGGGPGGPGAGVPPGYVPPYTGGVAFNPGTDQTPLLLAGAALLLVVAMKKG